MFPGCLISWSEDQIELVNWCKYYNTHYYSLPEEEKPRELIFKYSCLFDDFIDRKERRKKEQARKQKMKNKMGSNKRSIMNWSADG